MVLAEAPDETLGRTRPCPARLRALAEGQGPGPLTLARRPGTTAARPRGQGHEIREIRAFVEGDDPRHLDAAASARSGSPQLRAFHEDREPGVWLIADFRRPMLWGSARFRSVTVAEALAMAAGQALRAGGTLGLAVLGGTETGTETGAKAGAEAGTGAPGTALQVTAAGSGRAGLARVIGGLLQGHAAALAAAAPLTPLAPALQRCARLAPRGVRILLGSSLETRDAEDEAALAPALAALARRGPLALLLPVDPLETAPPAAALPWTDGAGQGGSGGLGGWPDALAAREAWARGLGLPLTRLDGAMCSQVANPVANPAPRTNRPGMNRPGTDRPGMNRPGTDRHGMNGPGTNGPRA